MKRIFNMRVSDQDNKIARSKSGELEMSNFIVDDTESINPSLGVSDNVISTQYAVKKYTDNTNVTMLNMLIDAINANQARFNTEEINCPVENTADYDYVSTLSEYDGVKQDFTHITGWDKEKYPTLWFVTNGGNYKIFTYNEIDYNSSKNIGVVENGIGAVDRPDNFLYGYQVFSVIKNQIEGSWLSGYFVTHTSWQNFSVTATIKAELNPNYKLATRKKIQNIPISASNIKVIVNEIGGDAYEYPVVRNGREHTYLGDFEGLVQEDITGRHYQNHRHYVHGEGIISGNLQNKDRGYVLPNTAYNAYIEKRSVKTNGILWSWIPLGNGNSTVYNMNLIDFILIGDFIHVLLTSGGTSDYDNYWVGRINAHTGEGDWEQFKPLSASNLFGYVFDQNSVLGIGSYSEDEIVLFKCKDVANVGDGNRFFFYKFSTDTFNEQVIMGGAPSCKVVFYLNEDGVILVREYNGAPAFAHYLEIYKPNGINPTKPYEGVTPENPFFALGYYIFFGEFLKDKYIFKGDDGSGTLIKWYEIAFSGASRYNIQEINATIGFPLSLYYQIDSANYANYSVKRIPFTINSAGEYYMYYVQGFPNQQNVSPINYNQQGIWKRKISGEWVKIASLFDIPCLYTTEEDGKSLNTKLPFWCITGLDVIEIDGQEKLIVYSNNRGISTNSQNWIMIQGYSQKFQPTSKFSILDYDETCPFHFGADPFVKRKDSEAQVGDSLFFNEKIAGYALRPDTHTITLRYIIDQTLQNISASS